jgi:hypothetical protein
MQLTFVILAEVVLIEQRLAFGIVNGGQDPRKDGAKGNSGSLPGVRRAAPDERLSWP